MTQEYQKGAVTLVNPKSHNFRKPREQRKELGDKQMFNYTQIQGATRAANASLENQNRMDSYSMPYQDNRDIKQNKFLRERDRKSEKQPLLNFSAKTQKDRLIGVLKSQQDIKDSEPISPKVLLSPKFRNENKEKWISKTNFNGTVGHCQSKSFHNAASINNSIDFSEPFIDGHEGIAQKVSMRARVVANEISKQEFNPTIPKDVWSRRLNNTQSIRQHEHIKARLNEQFGHQSSANDSMGQNKYQFSYSRAENVSPYNFMASNTDNSPQRSPANIELPDQSQKFSFQIAQRDSHTGLGLEQIKEEKHRKHKNQKRSVEIQDISVPLTAFLAPTTAAGAKNSNQEFHQRAKSNIDRIPQKINHISVQGADNVKEYLKMKKSPTKAPFVKASVQYQGSFNKRFSVMDEVSDIQLVQNFDSKKQYYKSGLGVLDIKGPVKPENSEEAYRPTSVPKIGQPRRISQTAINSARQSNNFTPVKNLQVLEQVPKSQSILLNRSDGQTNLTIQYGAFEMKHSLAPPGKSMFDETLNKMGTTFSNTGRSINPPVRNYGGGYQQSSRLFGQKPEGNVIRQFLSSNNSKSQLSQQKKLSHVLDMYFN